MTAATFCSVPTFNQMTYMYIFFWELLSNWLVTFIALLKLKYDYCNISAFLSLLQLIFAHNNLLRNVRVILQFLFITRFTRRHHNFATFCGIFVSQMTTICFTCKHIPVLSSFMAYHRVCNKINTTGGSSGAKNCSPFRSTWVHSSF